MQWVEGRFGSPCRERARSARRIGFSDASAGRISRWKLPQSRSRFRDRETRPISEIRNEDKKPSDTAGAGDGGQAERLPTRNEDISENRFSSICFSQRFIIREPGNLEFIRRTFSDPRLFRGVLSLLPLEMSPSAFPWPKIIIDISAPAASPLSSFQLCKKFLISFERYNDVGTKNRFSSLFSAGKIIDTGATFPIDCFPAGTVATSRAQSSGESFSNR